MRALLARVKTIAVVGLSDRPERPAYGVAAYLQRQGYRIIPVHPQATAVLGEKAYRALAEVPEPIDLVDVFRASDAVPELLGEMKSLGLALAWLQEGVTCGEIPAGMTVVQDRCLLKEHRRLLA
ncbi:MAG: CoA-binding protein [Acidobacteriaceae bacterium]|nr:CoA-binding protein [Acidobacteriaceae bacterium]